MPKQKSILKRSILDKNVYPDIDLIIPTGDDDLHGTQNLLGTRVNNKVEKYYNY